MLLTKLSLIQNLTRTQVKYGDNIPYLTQVSGVFSTGATGALAPAMLGQSITVTAL